MVKCHKNLIKRQCKAMPNNTNKQKRTYSPEKDLLGEYYAF